MNKYLLVLLITALPVNAGIYKWTDEHGNVHFGDQPINNQSATELNIRVNKKTGVTNTSGNNKDREDLLKQIAEDKEAKAEKKKKRIAANKKKRGMCNTYKSEYQNQIQSNRLYRMSPDGERTYLSDKGRAARLKKLKKGMAKYCR